MTKKSNPLVITTKKKKNPLALAFFTGKKNDRNVQNDCRFFDYVRNVLRSKPKFSIFPKPVCFVSFWHQQEFRNTNKHLTKSCACIKSFHRSTQVDKKNYHIAVVEGRCHPTRYSMPRPPPTEYEFHSCILVVDKATKSIFVFNPWKLGARPLVMTSISDIQPNLVRLIVKMYPVYGPHSYKTFYLGGNQTSQPDCRYRIMCTLREIGKLPDYSLRNHFDWIELN